jgi:predicted small integral membrane protein
MLDRKLKALFCGLLGLMALFWVIANIINLEAAYASFAYVLSLQDHAAYPNDIFPALGTPFVQIAAWVDFALEGAAAVLLLHGSWKLWQARNADTAKFEIAKTTAKLGLAAAVVVWFGLFCVFGGAAYGMWQTEVGGQSYNGAWQLCTFALLLLVYLNQKND